MIQRTLLIGLCALIFTRAEALGQSQPPAPATMPSALEVLKPYIGQWQIKATMVVRPEVRATYDWGLNRKFIVARTFVKLPDGREYQRYESIFAEKDGQIVCHGFVYNGESDVKRFTREGDKLSTEWTMGASMGGGKFRQSVELIDNDHIHWLVFRELDGKWEPMMDGKWERVAAAAAK